jgi:eukaryotic-like serine/threonine-protein kinase
MAGPDALLSQMVFHYRIIARLGGGGMGVIYKAEDTRFHRYVAREWIEFRGAGQDQAQTEAHSA